MSEPQDDKPLKCGPYLLHWSDDKKSARYISSNVKLYVEKKDDYLWKGWYETLTKTHTRDFFAHSPEGVVDEMWNTLTHIGTEMDGFSLGMTQNTCYKLIKLMGNQCPNCEVFWGSTHRSDCGYAFLERTCYVGDDYEDKISLRDYILLKR